MNKVDVRCFCSGRCLWANVCETFTEPLLMFKCVCSDACLYNWSSLVDDCIPL